MSIHVPQNLHDAMRSSVKNLAPKGKERFAGVDRMRYGVAVPSPHGLSHVARIERERSRKLHAGAETKWIPIHRRIKHIRHRHALWRLSWCRRRRWAHLLLLLLLLSRRMCRIRCAWVWSWSILALLALALLLVQYVCIVLLFFTAHMSA